MASLTSTDFITKFKNMTHREKMIATGLITGDEPGENDIGFDIALDLSGKQSWQLVDKILLDFKHKINPKYLKFYIKQLRTTLANLFRINSISEDLYVFYSRDRGHYKKSKKYNPNGISFRPLIFLVDNLKEHGWTKHIKGRYKKEIEKGKRSRMCPSNKLVQAFKDYEVTTKHLYAKQMDCIRLKDTKKKV